VVVRRQPRHAFDYAGFRRALLVGTPANEPSERIDLMPRAPGKRDLICLYFQQAHAEPAEPAANLTGDSCVKDNQHYLSRM